MLVIRVYWVCCMLWYCLLESSRMWLGLIMDDGKLEFCEAILFWHIDSDIWNHVIYFVYFEITLATLRVGDLSYCYEVETTVVIYKLAYFMIAVFKLISLMKYMCWLRLMHYLLIRRLIMSLQSSLFNAWFMSLRFSRFNTWLWVYDFHDLTLDDDV